MKTKPALTDSELLDLAEQAVNVLSGVLNDMPTSIEDVVGDDGMKVLRRFRRELDRRRKSLAQAEPK